MKPAVTFALALATLQASGHSYAADWVSLGKAGAVDQYFYDRSKLTIKDEEITFWKKVVFASPQTINGKEVISGLLRERIHCADHTAKLISYLYYSAAGETVEYIARDESDAAPIIPDTVGDAFEQKLCPLVWRKQEEARIRAEQKAAEAELSALKKTPATPEKPPAAPTASGTLPPPDGGPAPVRMPADPKGAPAGATPPGTTTIPGKTPPDPNPAPAQGQSLPMPQIIEQLY